MKKETIIAKTYQTRNIKHIHPNKQVVVIVITNNLN